MKNNNKYTKLYRMTDKFGDHRIYQPIEDEELAEFLLNRLMKKAKEEITEMISDEKISSKTYALEALASNDALANFINETADDELYSFGVELPVVVAKYSENPEIKRSAELFTKEYIDAFDADGELLKKAEDSIVSLVDEALKKKIDTSVVE